MRRQLPRRPPQRLDRRREACARRQRDGGTCSGNKPLQGAQGLRRYTDKRRQLRQGDCSPAARKSGTAALPQRRGRGGRGRGRSDSCCSQALTTEAGVPPPEAISLVLYSGKSVHSHGDLSYPVCTYFLKFVFSFEPPPPFSGQSSRWANKSPFFSVSRFSFPPHDWLTDLCVLF